MIKRVTMQWLALGAVLGPGLFDLSWLLQRFLSPRYSISIQFVQGSQVSQPVSGSSLAPIRPFVDTAFLLCGLLLLAGIIGIFHSIPEMTPLKRWVCISVLALPPLSQITSDMLSREWIVARTVGFSLAFASPVVTFLIAGLLLRRLPRWRTFGNGLLLASPLTLIMLVLFFSTFNAASKRLLIVEVEAWYVALGWLTFARSLG